MIVYPKAKKEEFDECHEDTEINTKGTIKRRANKKAQKGKVSMKAVEKRKSNARKSSEKKWHRLSIKTNKCCFSNL